MRDGGPVNLARTARTRAASTLYGAELPEIAVPRGDGAVRIDYVPGRPADDQTRPLHAARAPGRADAATSLPGGLGEHKWSDRRLLDALSTDGTTPLLLDADGTVLEAAWATVLIRARRRRSTRRARTAGSCPSTSRPDASRPICGLQPGDELLLSSSLAGVVPAVLAGCQPGTARRYASYSEPNWRR